MKVAKPAQPTSSRKIRKSALFQFPCNNLYNLPIRSRNTMPREPGPPTFLDLPAELRLRIYTHVLAPSGTICLCRSFKHAQYGKGHDWLPVALLQTCTQIYNEASEVLFDRNLFVLNELEGIQRCDCQRPRRILSGKPLPPHVYPRIMHLRLPVGILMHPCNLLALQSMVALKTLQIRIPCTIIDTPYCQAEAAKDALMLGAVPERIPACTRVSFVGLHDKPDVYGKLVPHELTENREAFIRLQAASGFSRQGRLSGSVVDHSRACHRATDGCVEGLDCTQPVPKFCYPYTPRPHTPRTQPTVSRWHIVLSCVSSVSGFNVVKHWYK